MPRPLPVTTESTDRIATRRRELLLAIGHVGLFCGATGVPLVAWGQSTDGQDALYRAILTDITKGKTRSRMEALVDDATKTPPGQAIGELQKLYDTNFDIRTQLAAQIRKLDKKHRDLLVNRQEATYLDLPAEIRLNLQKEIDGNKIDSVPVITKPPLHLPPSLGSGELKLLTVSDVGVGDCGWLLAKILLLAAIGPSDAITENDANAFMRALRGDLSPVARAVQKGDMESLKGSVIKLITDMSTLEFTKKVAGDVGKEVARRLLKKVLKTFAQYLVPYVGIALYVADVLVLVKDNWNELQQSCQSLVAISGSDLGGVPA